MSYNSESAKMIIPNITKHEIFAKYFLGCGDEKNNNPSRIQKKLSVDLYNNKSAQNVNLKIFAKQCGRLLEFKGPVVLTGN